MAAGNPAHMHRYNLAIKPDRKDQFPSVLLKATWNRLELPGAIQRPPECHFEPPRVYGAIQNHLEAIQHHREFSRDVQRPAVRRHPEPPEDVWRPSRAVQRGAVRRKAVWHGAMPSGAATPSGTSKVRYGIRPSGSDMKSFLTCYMFIYNYTVTECAILTLLTELQATYSVSCVSASY